MNKGFTLFELLLVIGVMGILAYLSMPIGFTFYRAQVVDSARGQLMETLSKARHNAVAQKYDSRYGVKINTIGGSLTDFTLYKGDAFNGLNYDSTYNEVYSQTANLRITATGSAALSGGDINFSKLVGTTTATGTITIINLDGNETRSVLIDDFGNAYEQ